MLRLSALCHDRLDERDDLLVQLMGSKDRVDHLLLRHFIGTSLDHDHLLFCRGNRERKIGSFLLRCSRIKYELIIHHAYLGRRDRSVKRNIGYGSGNCRSEHCREFRRAVLVYG